METLNKKQKSEKVEELEKEAKQELEKIGKFLMIGTREDIEAAKKAYQGRKKNDLIKLKPWHMWVIRKLVLEGKTIRELHEETGTSKQYIGYICNTTAGRQYMEEITNKIDTQMLRNRVRALANRSIKVLEEILTSDNPELVSLKATLARDILDRLGVQETKEEKVTYEHVFKNIRDTIESISKKKEEERPKILDVSGTA